MKKQRAVREFSKRLKRFLRKRGLTLLEIRAVLICERNGKMLQYALLFKTGGMKRELETKLEEEA